MMTISHSIEIDVPPSRVFDWFVHLDEHYKEWHKDHVYYKYDTEQVDVGTTASYCEYLHGKLHKMRFRLTRIEEDRLIEFRNLFPVSLICPRGSFIMELSGKGTRFTATLTFKGSKLLAKLEGKKVQAMEQHIREEGENLKRILEQ